MNGRDAWGNKPDASGFRRSAFDEYGNEHPVTLLRLAAPSGDAGPEWNGIETYTERKFRWSAGTKMEWVVTSEPLPRGRLQCFIPLLVSTDGMCEGARIVLGNQSKPVKATRQSLIAEFDHDGLPAGTVVKLTLPPPSARDNQRVGLAITVESDQDGVAAGSLIQRTTPRPLTTSAAEQQKIAQPVASAPASTRPFRRRTLVSQ